MNFISTESFKQNEFKIQISRIIKAELLFTGKI